METQLVSTLETRRSQRVNTEINYIENLLLLHGLVQILIHIFAGQNEQIFIPTYMVTTACHDYIEKLFVLILFQS